MNRNLKYFLILKFPFSLTQILSQKPLLRQMLNFKLDGTLSDGLYFSNQFNFLFEYSIILILDIVLYVRH